jgi:hypothetical protein
LQSDHLAKRRHRAGAAVAFLDRLAQRIGRQRLTARHVDLLWRHRQCADPGQQFVAVGMAGKRVDARDLRMHRQVLAKDLDRLRAADDRRTARAGPAAQ